MVLAHSIADQCMTMLEKMLVFLIGLKPDAKALCNFFSQYAGVPLTVLKKIKALSLAINYCTLCLKFLLSIPASLSLRLCESNQ